MIFRKATNFDIAGVIELQSTYLLANIAEAERENGFVTTPFTIEQIEQAIAIDGVFIAEDENKIVAYAFAASWDYFSQWKIFTFMVRRLPSLEFTSETITTKNSFQYGPICIDENYRGSGLFQQLGELMRIEMNQQYSIGITFINKINKRSFEAHTKKLKIKVIDHFEFNENHYYGLAFLTSETVLE